METIDEIENVKGKEFTIAKILFLIAVIIFIIPIVLILVLKFLYNLTQIAKSSINSTVNMDESCNKAYSNQ